MEVFLFDLSTWLAQNIAYVISEQQNKPQSNNPLEQQRESPLYLHLSLTKI